MAEGTSSSSGNGGLAFIVGGLVVIVAIIAFVVYSGGFSQKKSVDVNISASAPQLPDAPKLPGN
ncbi:hypothetical protein ACN2C6_05775 [Caulobacter sp. ErkDOM-YI]|uniref:hypothetical protein n=1 Tax=unclassified Caulobacter TaxID=2648921 RepID=UPI003AF57D23